MSGLKGSMLSAASLSIVLISNHTPRDITGLFIEYSIQMSP